MTHRYTKAEMARRERADRLHTRLKQILEQGFPLQVSTREFRHLMREFAALLRLERAAERKVLWPWMAG